MHQLTRKLHTYVGLLNLTAIVVFGVAGLLATQFIPPQARPKPVGVVTFESISIPPNLTDQELYHHVCRSVHFPMKDPPIKIPGKRDEENNLAFDLFTPGGRRRITVLEKENRLRIETFKPTVWQFMSGLHEDTGRRGSSHVPLQVWSWYNQFAIWSLVWMAGTGIYLWLASRPKFRVAQVAFAIASLTFLFVYAMVR